ncbi:SDR family oxidoreductase [Streptomyces malaysiensis]|uniref:NAD-dependent epimerase/dehydratase n=1 Tax=Streptomyces malaysiensis TaxID=92644 RepID=A0A7X6B0R1_STRMQ|nr:SDR family oxidoreductase [Streptomyces malaysiensis]NIY69383.1 NAD-dependent epimerase/dehydratase [Streptomyces malaysiensis]
MRVFVTGGTGFIGSAVVRDLIEAGHEVLALARSEDSAASLQAAGATAHPGSLEEPERVREGAARSDAVIHTAFDNKSITRFPRNSRIERAALQAVAEVFAGTDRPLVAAGGFAPVIASGPVFTEDDLASSKAGPVGRNVERTIMGLAESGVNASIVRMPCVHGDGDRFTLPRFIEFARKHSTSGYIGQGENRLPAVHHTDAARVFRLAVERAVPAGRYHAVAEEGVPYRSIAEVIGRRLGVPAVSMSPLKARRHFGLYTAYAEGDGPASSTTTRELLGWVPEGPGLLEDLDRPEYFTS